MANVGGTEVVRALGLMSGTSLDGIDVALVETDGETIRRLGPAATYPYPDADRAAIREAIAAARGLPARDARPPALARAERLVTERHAEAVERFAAECAVPLDGIDVVGFHGQTVLHEPERGLTLQIGDGEALARRLGRDVVYDMRAADVAAGGQGAPLVPVVHAALANMLRLAPPLVLLNVGGVANVTAIGSDGNLIAFDTGPGNALLDDFVFARTGERMDRDGRLAAAGRAREDIVAAHLGHPYFAAPPPKSLDRDAFAGLLDACASLSLEDGAATLAAFTAAAVERGLGQLPERPLRLVVAGGGARNPTLLSLLKARTGVPVDPLDALGANAEALEAQAFAVLAVRSRRGLPLTFPGTTGIARPLTGGRLARGDLGPRA